MKKFIIISIIVILLAGATIAALVYFNSFQKVSIVLGEGVTSAHLHKVDPEKGHSHEIVGDDLQELTASGELSLQNGSYFIIPEGDKISKEEIGFTVNGSPLTVEVKPGYSEEYLSSVLKTEEPTITTAITERFPAEAQNYTVTKGTLYEKADWYGALLVRKVSDPRDQRDYYRIVLHKQNDVWQVVNTPQLVLTSAEFKDVPVDVLRAINQLNP